MLCARTYPRIRWAEAHCNQLVTCVSTNWTTIANSPFQGDYGDQVVADASDLEQRAKHVMHDPAVPVVVRLAGGIDAHDGGEFAAVGADGDRARNGATIECFGAGDGKGFLSGQPQAGRGLTLLVLQRK